jgi:hypothetical protein
MQDGRGTRPLRDRLQKGQSQTRVFNVSRSSTRTQTLVWREALAAADAIQFRCPNGEVDYKSCAVSTRFTLAAALLPVEQALPRLTIP